MAGREIKVTLIGDADQLNKTFKQSADSAETLGSKLKTMGTIAGASMVAIGAAALKIGAQWDDATDSIAAATGKTGNELEGLTASFKDVFTSVPVSAGQASTAISELSKRLNLTGEPLEKMSKQFLNLSRVTGTDLSTNIANMTRVFGDWSIATDDQGLAMDKMLKASQATGAGMDQLSAQVVQFGGPMRALGFSFEETLAILGKFEKEGVNTELVMGSMRIALGKMAKAGEEPVETLARVSEAIKGAGSTSEAVGIAIELFGQKAGPDMALAIREGRFAIDELVGTIEGGGGAIDQAIADTDGWRESLVLLRNQAIAMVGPFADFAGLALTIGGSAVVMAAQIGPAMAAISTGATTAATAMKALGAATALSNPIMLALVLALAVLSTGFLTASNDGKELTATVEAMTDKTGELARVVAAQAEIDKNAGNASAGRWIELEKLRIELEAQIAAETVATEATKAQEQATVSAARASGDFDQKITDLNATLDGMTTAATAAFGALDKFRNVPTVEQIELAARIADTNFQLEVHQQRLDNGTAAAQGTEAADRALVEALTLEKTALDDTNTVLDLARERAIAMGSAKAAASGQVAGLVGTEGELLGAVDGASAALSGQASAAANLTTILHGVAAAAQNAMQAMINMIVGGGPAANQAAATVAQGVVGTFGDEWMIQSPSKVFENIGTMAMQGLVNGIVNMKDPLLRTFGEIFDAIAPKIRLSNPSLVDALADMGALMHDAALVNVHDPLLRTFGEIFDKIAPLIRAGGPSLVDAVNDMGALLRDFAAVAAGEMVDAFEGGFNDLKPVLDNVVASTHGTVEQLKSMWVDWLNSTHVTQERLADYWANFNVTLKQLADGMVGFIAEDFSLVVDSFYDLTDGVKAGLAPLTPFLHSVGDAIKLWGAGIVSEMTDTFKQALAISAQIAAAGASGSSVAVLGGTTASVASRVAAPAYAAPSASGAVTQAQMDYIDAMNAMPSYAHGTSFVPRNMLAKLHKGERVVPASENRGSGGGDGITVFGNYQQVFPNVRNGDDFMRSLDWQVP